MIGQVEKSPQLEIFKIPLRHKISEDHELVRLSRKINWDKLTGSLSVFYSPDKGRRGVPVRKIAGMIILKDIFETTDEGILRQWLENPYFQFFCGEIYQQNELPFNRSEMVKFRSRIGESGMGIIFSPEVLVAIDEIQADKHGHAFQPVSKWHLIRLLQQILSGK